jgi:hypothetical protein
MAYIGTKPTIGNFQICDAISVVNGQAAYTMQVGSVNVSPQSANHMIVSLNGTIQKPGSSFTVSGSTITFASNLATGDVIDFIQILGDVLDLGVPSDATVTTAKLADNNVTTAKINDNAVTSAKMFSTFKNGITVADQYRLTTNTTWTTSNTTLTAWERVDTDGTGAIGSAMSVSSGIFTFPSTGTYLIQAQAFVSIANDQRFNSFIIQTTLDNSSYDNASSGSQFIQVTESNFTSGSIYASFIFNVSDTTNRKVRFQIGASGTNGNCGGDTNSNSTAVHFIRLGDST